MDQKNSIVKRIAMILLTVLIVGLGLLMLYMLARLDLLPAKLMVLITVSFLLVIAFFIAFFWLKKPYAWQKAVCTILAVFLLIIEGTGASYLYKASSTLSSITSSSSDFTALAQLIVLNDSDVKDKTQLNGQKVGMLKFLDTAGSTAIADNLTVSRVDVEKKEYDSLLEMTKDLYSKKIAAMIINSNLRSTIADDETYQDFDNQTHVIDAITYFSKRTSSTMAVDSITGTPFTVLISGSDSRNGLEETARSDVNMVVTVNPLTKTVLLVGIPRDFYVETVCDAQAGCPQGQMDKLTHTGLFGVDTTKKTIEKLLGITINYTLRVNFDSVVKLVNALGGIEVYVEPGLAVESFRTMPSFGVSEGWNSLNGKQALAFSRERYAYLEGDRQRVKNQQIVLEAIAKKAMSPAMIVQYSKFMDALSGAMETDITQEEIQDLIKFQLDGNPKWTFYSYSVNGDGGMDYVASAGSQAYVMYPFQETVDKAREYIMATLDGNDELLKNIAKEADGDKETVE